MMRWRAGPRLGGAGAGSAEGRAGRALGGGRRRRRRRAIEGGNVSTHSKTQTAAVRRFWGTDTDGDRRQSGSDGQRGFSR